LGRCLHKNIFFPAFYLLKDNLFLVPFGEKRGRGDFFEVSELGGSVLGLLIG